MTISAIRSYRLRQSRISDAQRHSYNTLSSLYCLERTGSEREGKDFFGNDNPLVLEIGFGMGSATAIIAEQNPDINYLGIEVHKPGIGKLLWEIEKRSLKNIRIFEGDAAEIIKDEILPCSVSAFHIFFPDPWPKKRHHKRRLIVRPFTQLLCSRLAEGGYIYMVTDSDSYAEHALEELTLTDGLKNPWNGGYAPPQSWRPQTKFEKKGLEKQHQIKELYFKKSYAY